MTQAEIEEYSVDVSDRPFDPDAVLVKVTHKGRKVGVVYGGTLSAGIFRAASIIANDFHNRSKTNG